MKRYDHYQAYDGSAMSEDADGEYVLYTDVENMEVQHAILRTALRSSEALVTVLVAAFHEMHTAPAGFHSNPDAQHIAYEALMKAGKL